MRRAIPSISCSTRSAKRSSADQSERQTIDYARRARVIDASNGAGGSAQGAGGAAIANHRQPSQPQHRLVRGDRTAHLGPGALGTSTFGTAA